MYNNIFPTFANTLQKLKGIDGKATDKSLLRQNRGCQAPPRRPTPNAMAQPSAGEQDYNINAPDTS